MAAIGAVKIGKRMTLMLDGRDAGYVDFDDEGHIAGAVVEFLGIRKRLSAADIQAAATIQGFDYSACFGTRARVSWA